MVAFPTRTCTAVLAAILALLGRIVPSDAAQVEVRARMDHGEIVLVASAVIDADAATAWRVLTDYARYPQFVPGVRECRVTRRNGSAVTVEQSGSALLGIVQLPIAIVYEIIESAPSELRSSAEIASIGTLDSHYTLRQLGNRVALEYGGRLVPRFDVPRALEELAARQTVARQFQALADEIERQQSIPLGVEIGPDAPDAPRRSGKPPGPSEAPCASADNGRCGA